MSHRYDEMSVADLRKRTSAKWSTYGPDVLPLWVAEMDFPLADPIRRVLHELVDRGDTGYAVGRPLAEAFARFAAVRYRWDVDPALAWACPDAMSGVEYALRALTRPGDAVAFFTPAYPPFFGSVDWIGRRVVQVPLAISADGAVAPDLDALRAALADGAAAILLCNPHNPTGRCLTRAELVAVAELADRHGVPVVSDEIHAPLVLDPASGGHIPFPAVDADSVCVHSASKGWNLPGLKAALLIAGSPGIAARLASPELDHLCESAGIAGVAAGIAAFDEGASWLDDTVGYIAGNHRLVRDELPRALPGARVTPAEATYLAWVDLRHVAALRGAESPGNLLLERAKVALVPGERFGSRYRGSARINVATSRTVLREAIGRLATLAG